MRVGVWACVCVCVAVWDVVLFRFVNGAEALGQSNDDDDDDDEDDDDNHNSDNNAQRGRFAVLLQIGRYAVMAFVFLPLRCA